MPSRFLMRLLGAAAFASFSTALLPETAASKSFSIELDQGTNISVSSAPGRDRLVIDLHGVLWVVPFSGGVAKPITDWRTEATQPVWSPDGQLIAFQAYTTGTYHIWTIKPDGSELTQRTFGLSDDREPSWSPDGRKLAFASDRANQGSFDIWTLELTTGGLDRRTDSPTEEYEPVWSPDGQHIGFNEDGQAAVIIDMAGKRTVAVRASERLRAPAWRPRLGQTASVVYLNGPAVGRGPAPLTINDSDGKVVVGGEDIFPFRPVFLSADEVLYTADGVIKFRNLKSGSTTVIPFKATELIDRQPLAPKDRGYSDTTPKAVQGIAYPRISPDGKVLLFNALSDLYTASAGHATEALTHDTFWEHSPAWSTDGSAVFYISDKSGSSAFYRREISSGAEKHYPLPNLLTGAVMSPNAQKIAYFDTSGFIQIYDVPSGRVRKVGEGGRNYSNHLSWSPDNRHVATSVKQQVNRRFREGLNLIRIINTDTGEARTYQPGSADSISMRSSESGPFWSPNGNWLAYVMQGHIWVMPVAVDGSPLGAPRQVTEETADAPSWSADSKRLAYIHHDVVRTIELDGGRTVDLPIDLKYVQSVPQQTVVVHAGRVWDGLKARYDRDMDITIRNDRIVGLGPHRSRLPLPGATYVDARHLTVIPGLNDLHMHPIDSSNKVRFWRSYLSLGITSVLSMGSPLHETIGKREALASGQMIGPRLSAGGELIDGSRINYNANRVITSDAELEGELEREKALNVDYMKTYIRMSGRQMEMVGKAAREIGAGSGSHYAWPGAQSGQSLTGHLSALSRLGNSATVSPAGVSYGDATALYTKTDFQLVHTPIAGWMLGRDPALLEDRRVKNLVMDSFKSDVLADAAPVKESQIENLKRSTLAVMRISRSGGLVGLGTDGNALELQMNLRGLVVGGFSPLEALKMATSNAAKIAGVEKDLGSIAPGKIADLVFIKGDPLNNIDDAIKVEQVMKGGRLFSQDELFAGIN